MRLLQLAEYVLLVATTLAPASPKVDGLKAEAKPAIRFPDVVPAPLPPAPPPKPDPAAFIMLNAGELYVVEGDAFEIRAFPAGKVAITKGGPRVVYGKFVGGTGDYEERTFTGPTVAIVRAIANGDITLVVRPGDAKSEADWLERSIRSNVGPQPPPDDGKKGIPPPKPKPPDPKPDPEPKPAPDVVTGPLWVVTVTQSELRTPEESSLLNDHQFWNGVEKAGHTYRHYDADEPSAVKSGYAKVYASLGSCLVVVKPDGTVVKKIKLPPLTTDVAAILKELTGK